LNFTHGSRRLVEHMLARTSDDLRSAVEAIEPQLIAWRRHLHRHPELSFAETETAAFVERTLSGLGVELTRPTTTSVVATLRTGRPGRTVAVRADLDALPVQERSGVAFASVHDGVMHACGHDGHTAVALALGHLLAGLGGRLGGEVRLIFQHAEELGAGAPELVAAGVLDGVDAIVGEHLWTPLPVGTVGVVAGPLMASADFFDIEVRGRGGHAGLPHEAVDPVAAAAEIVVNLQHLVAREMDPLASVVVSVTGSEGGEFHNVIPERATLRGTIRTLDEAVRAGLPARMQRIAGGVAAAHGAEAEVSCRPGPPAVINHPEVTAVVASAARRQLGDEAVREVRPVMAGDDFSYYQQAVPGAYVLVGAGSAPHATFPHHHPRFVLDEAALPLALCVLADAVLELTGGAGS
jgi:amidohydrolase